MIRRLCSFPGCGKFAVEGTTRCEKHQLQKKEFPKTGWLSDDQRKFYRTSRWKTLKNRIIQEHPYCSRCGATENLQVHHLNRDYFNDEDFFSGPFEVLCGNCHSLESRRRGQERK